jgi:glycosyltransferase involved in cell wall biosynthesis
MRVLVYPHAMDIGGSQLNAIELAGAVRDRGHEVLVAGESGPLLASVQDLGLEHVEIPTDRRRPSAAVSRLLVRLVRERRIDVVHGYEWPPGVEAFLGPRLRAGVPAVCTIMSMAVAPFLPRRMPLLVGTEEIRLRAIDAGHTDVVLLEPPVDIHKNSPQFEGAGFRAAYGIEPGTPLVVVVSRLARELKLEGLLSACDAVADLAVDGVDVRLAIVGGGPVSELVAERAAHANNVAGREAVILTGALADPRGAYAAGDVLLGMGGSALRAMAFGKPLIVQGERGFWEPVTPDSTAPFLLGGWYGIGDGGDGRLRLRAALEPLLADADRRRRLGEYGRALVVERFSLETAAARQEEVYAAALASPSNSLDLLSDAARTTLLISRHVGRRKLRRIFGAPVPVDDFNAVADKPAPATGTTTGPVFSRVSG